MAQTTTAQLFSNPLQFVVESTEGTTPTASPSFTVCPPVKSLSIKKDGGYVDVAQIGPEDLAALIQGLKTYETQVVFYLSDTATDEAFFQRCINAANFGTPSGTISETFSMLASYYLAGTLNYLLFRGTRAKNVAVKMAMGAAHEITVDFVHTDIPDPDTGHGLTTPTLVTSANGGTIQDWLSGGATPVALIGVTLEATEFNCTINRNTSVAHILGSANPHSSQPHGRRIAGDIKTLHTVITNETNYETPTSGTITAVLDSGATTLTISNASIVSFGRDVSGEDTEETVEDIGFRSLSVSIA